jgi:hypothetical protein
MRQTVLSYWCKAGFLDCQGPDPYLMNKVLRLARLYRTTMPGGPDPYLMNKVLRRSEIVRMADS